MIDSLEFAHILKSQFSFFAGVPDSLLKPINNALEEILPKEQFFITSNEGQAIAFASAYYLATKQIACVYMQNSGLGNAINPILSLADPEVYAIPMVLFIGLRGGKDDEPQHAKQGKVTKDILDACKIENHILDKDIAIAKQQIYNAVKKSKNEAKIIAFLIEKNTFSTYHLKRKTNTYKIIREHAISLVHDVFADAKIVATTGFISRECYELREIKNQKHYNDFLVVGSMGYASSLAYILSKYSQKKVVCLDGDGAFIMHMGSILNFKGSNFLHIVLNNEIHDSVGGQSTNAKNASFVKLAKSCGYDYCFSISNISQLKRKLKEIKELKGLIFLEIKVKQYTRSDLGRPKNILRLKEDFCKEF
ncbi:phosphonopyruvate decarboxylase [Campylobacter sp. CNRCH_2014_0184h]|uniref:phosphonopyruvate decarboxylase n=1 Tax=Campylobacter sp. CNRCH_2014_0184h TaxID=2911602 RepID=UPI0021E65CD6|nr:phosphonopyruvate decarboxylase [Campylobacter sp. CNRCH_2014_0184h]MCV3482452.1 phosphonopyruvate decarboxylase [Campylobacter sp. CNRCH_2014_0184h]